MSGKYQKGNSLLVSLFVIFILIGGVSVSLNSVIQESKMTQVFIDETKISCVLENTFELLRNYLYKLTCDPKSTNVLFSPNCFRKTSIINFNSAFTTANISGNMPNITVNNVEIKAGPPFFNETPSSSKYYDSEIFLGIKLTTSTSILANNFQYAAQTVKIERRPVSEYHILWEGDMTGITVNVNWLYSIHVNGNYRSGISTINALDGSSNPILSFNKLTTTRGVYLIPENSLNPYAYDTNTYSFTAAGGDLNAKYMNYYASNVSGYIQPSTSYYVNAGTQIQGAYNATSYWNASYPTFETYAFSKVGLNLETRAKQVRLQGFDPTQYNGAHTLDNSSNEYYLEKYLGGSSILLSETTVPLTNVLTAAQALRGLNTDQTNEKIDLAFSQRIHNNPCISIAFEFDKTGRSFVDFSKFSRNLCEVVPYSFPLLNTSTYTYIGEDQDTVASTDSAALLAYQSRTQGFPAYPFTSKVIKGTDSILCPVTKFSAYVFKEDAKSSKLATESKSGYQKIGSDKKLSYYTTSPDISLCKFPLPLPSPSSAPYWRFINFTTSTDSVPESLTWNNSEGKWVESTRKVNLPEHNIIMYDKSRRKWVYLIELDIANLKAENDMPAGWNNTICFNKNFQLSDYFIENQHKVASHDLTSNYRTNRNNFISTYNKSTAAIMPEDLFVGIRLVNCTELPTGGLTIASEYPLYIKGNFNTVNTKPALLIADSITLLSNEWKDYKSRYRSDSPNANIPTSQLHIYAHIITGAPHQDYYLDYIQSSTFRGHMENGYLGAFRTLEKFNSVATIITMGGSLFCPFRSKGKWEPWSRMFGSDAKQSIAGLAFDPKLWSLSLPNCMPYFNRIKRGRLTTKIGQTEYTSLTNICNIDWSLDENTYSTYLSSLPSILTPNN